jgi:hypothetical protein
MTMTLCLPKSYVYRDVSLIRVTERWRGERRRRRLGRALKFGEARGGQLRDREHFMCAPLHRGSKC